MTVLNSTTPHDLPRDGIAASFVEAMHPRAQTDNFFPEMKLDWRAYPNSVGHFHSDGCFRCHDGNHFSAAGKSIRHDCRVCHEIISQGTGKAVAEISPQGLAFQHPEDVGGMWQNYKYSFYHDGGLVEWKRERNAQYER